VWVKQKQRHVISLVNGCDPSSLWLGSNEMSACPAGSLLGQLLRLEVDSYPFSSMSIIDQNPNSVNGLLSLIRIKQFLISWLELFRTSPDNYNLH